MKKILLVEDDSFLAEMYTAKFDQNGFETVLADNGENALKILNEQNVDLVLLDVVMPRMDGWEVLKTIRGKESLKSLPVVLLTNLGQRNDIEKGRKLGADGYLVKAHFTPSEVVEKAKEYLR